MGWVIYAFVMGVVIARTNWRGLMAPPDNECLWCKGDERELALEYVAYRYPNHDRVFAGQACWVCHSYIEEEISKGDLVRVL